MSQLTDLRPGDPREIAGYQVLSRLGSGGQGVVYLATAPSGERVAIKQLLPGPRDERARQQFAKEVAAVRRVAPFCTARVLDAQLDGPSPYVVSEYIEGLSLAQQVREHGPMAGVTLQRLAIGTITALAAIHQAGVVHRDFKPANVMLAADGPRVIDFGIARDLSAELTMTGTVAGTPTYMAPEQLRGDRIGPAADIFAWASVVAYAATGRAPFEAPHMMATVYRITSGEADLTGVPADLAPVLRHCLEKDPARRPSAQQALALLLGRPAPAHDAQDATQVLAEAAGLVHAGETRPYPAVAPDAGTRPYPGASSYPGSQQYPPRYPPQGPTWGGPVEAATGSDGHRGRTPFLVALVLVLVLAVAWALVHSGLLAGPKDGSAAGTSTGAATSPVHRPARSAVAKPVGAATTAPQPTTAAPSTAAATEAPTTDPAGGGTTAPAGGAGGGVAAGTVPARFAGVWKGLGTQPNGVRTTWTARITLGAGNSTGRMQLLDFGCSGPLTVASATSRLLVLDAVIDHDPQGLCAPHGTLWLTPVGPERLNFVWQDVDHPNNQATGQLHRT